MQVYYAELELEEGFELIAKDKESRLIRGKRVSAPSGRLLFEHLHSTYQPLRCWECGILASCWVANKGRKDEVSQPTVDLFAKVNGAYILMTRDHIIPRSYGGSNHVDNLRVGCGPCNHNRGNALDAEDVKFMRENKHLIEHWRAGILILPKDVTELPKSDSAAPKGSLKAAEPYDEEAAEKKRIEKRRERNQKKRARTKRVKERNAALAIGT